MKKVLTLFIGCIFLSISIKAQDVDRSLFIKDSLDIYISRALTQWRLPGIAVCVVKDGKVVVMKGYGTKELGLPGRVDENSLFMIGGNTQSFTATLMAMLDAGGKLSLSDNVNRYLPQFKLDNKTANDQATIADLLSNRIGFKSLQGDFSFYNTDLSRKQIMEKLGHIKAAYPFRNKWGYSNPAYMVAGEIIPRLTAKDWETYIKEHLFAPLNMTNTLALTRDLPLWYNRTVPHTLVNGRLTPIPYAQLDNMAAAMSISSSASDMGKWVMALLNNGKVGEKQVISLAAINTTFKQQEIVGPITRLAGETVNEAYGLGWFLRDYAGQHLVMHDGGVNGYLSSVTLVPQEHLGIIILTNTDKNQLYDALRWQILDAYLKRPYKNYSDIALNKYKIADAKEQQLTRRLRDSVFLNLPTAQPLANYMGKYVNDVYGTVTVTRGENNNLEMRFEHHPKMYVLLQPLGGNRFYATFSDPVYGKAIFPFIFQNGRITGVKVKVDDKVEPDPYDFMKVD